MQRVKLLFNVYARLSISNNNEYLLHIFIMNTIVETLYIPKGKSTYQHIAWTWEWCCDAGS